MDNNFIRDIKGFHKELEECVVSDHAILFLVNHANCLVKKAQYDKGHAILDYTRLNYMKREARELSEKEKARLLKLQIQKSLLFLGQNNMGGAKLMISVGENMQKKLLEDSEELKELIKLFGYENIHQIFLQAVKDDRFDLNNLKITLGLLAEQACLSPENNKLSNSQKDESSKMVFEIKPYGTSN